MKVTQVLFKQHIGKMFIKHWMIQGKRKTVDTGVHKVLRERNIQVCKPEDIFNEDRNVTMPEIVGVAPKPIEFNNTHPNWHDRVCLTFKDENVLLEGLNQAKVLTKTVEVKKGLPDKMVLKNVSKEIDNRVKNIILYSHLFDAEQKKLPKLKDPLRPAWNFPRVYGITDNRVNLLITSKLINLIETLSDPVLVSTRNVLNDLYFSFPFEKSGDLIQFQLRADTFLTASEPLGSIATEQLDEVELPNLFPVKETVTLNGENIYELRNIYPINKQVSRSHPHTLFVHFNGTEVKNLFEEEVTETQIHGRSLLKAFTVAASYARQIHGEQVLKLPKPVTVQCVQTDGRLFNFGIFQLNTLDLESSDGQKNVWYQTEQIPLFSSCSYKLGKPTLEGYNNEVIKNLICFYQNF